MNELNLGVRQRGVTTAETFTYILIVIVLAAVVAGFYLNSNLNSAIEEALALGEIEKELIEEYFETHGQMPRSGAEAGLDRFTPDGVLKGLTWRPGALGEPSPDNLRTGTLNGILDLSEFGARFEKHESGYLLIARAQDDGTVIWDCLADEVTPDALPESYLPESCKRASDSDG